MHIGEVLWNPIKPGLPEPTSAILDDSMLTAVVNATEAFVAILDSQREIVFANETLLETFDHDLVAALGQRFGALAGCRNADEAPDGCGTTPGCMECGANQAIRAAQESLRVQEECRILRRDGEPIDLAVTATPLTIGGGTYTLLTAVDISDRKRRESLERIFFHDIMNTASGVHGLSAMVRSVPVEERDGLLDMIEQASGQLIDEISAQRELLAAETTELETHPQRVHSLQLLHTVVGLYSSHDVAHGKRLVVDAKSDDVEFVADPVLLARVLGNLTKNALEASRTGDTVTLASTTRGSSVEFTIHNPAFIPSSAQRQIFQRSFTTKGRGRGLGTYSSRFITQRYLHGDLQFESSPDDGTTFRAAYPIAP
ncbi:MAG: ATP-binding protein [Acidimicrobiia bacterium]|nr:ATP-binding protein [Acidimicrobiia bacterium]